MVMLQKACVDAGFEVILSRSVDAIDGNLYLDRRIQRLPKEAECTSIDESTRSGDALAGDRAANWPMLARIEPVPMRLTGKNVTQRAGNRAFACDDSSIADTFAGAMLADVPQKGHQGSDPFAENRDRTERATSALFEVPKATGRLNG